MVPPLSYTVHFFFLLLLAGTKATVCGLSAVQSHSCCEQTCWLLSAVDFTNAIVGHRGVSKRDSPKQHITVKRHTQRYSRDTCKGWSDHIHTLNLWQSFCLFRSIYLPTSPHSLSHTDKLEGMEYSAHVSESISHLWPCSLPLPWVAGVRDWRAGIPAQQTHEPHQPLIAA